MATLAKEELFDLRTNAQVATVTGVGIDPYNVVITEEPEED